MTPTPTTSRYSSSTVRWGAGAGATSRLNRTVASAVQPHNNIDTARRPTITTRRFPTLPIADLRPLRPRLRGRGRRRGRTLSGATVAELPSLVPEDADDALGRYRKVMTGLYAAGGLLHVPDLLGKGPISAAVGTSSFWELSPLLQAVTVGWAVLGPVAAVGLGTGQAWGDAILVGVASTEIVLGIDFSDAMAPAAIPREVVTVICSQNFIMIRCTSFPSSIKKIMMNSPAPPTASFEHVAGDG